MKVRKPDAISVRLFLHLRNEEGLVCVNRCVNQNGNNKKKATYIISKWLIMSVIPVGFEPTTAFLEGVDRGVLVSCFHLLLLCKSVI